jgi:hypothetical protein
LNVSGAIKSMLYAQAIIWVLALGDDIHARLYQNQIVTQTILWATRGREHTPKSRASAAMGGVVKQHDRSWPKLLAFFALATLASSLVFAAVLAGVTVAIAGGETPQVLDDQQVDPAVSGQTFSGFITDANCGPRHTDSEQSATECARMCVRNGSRYIVVDGDRNYELAGDPRLFGEFAGQRVSLTGVLSGNTIKVSSMGVQTAGRAQ